MSGAETSQAVPTVLLWIAATLVIVWLAASAVSAFCGAMAAYYGLRVKRATSGLLRGVLGAYSGAKTDRVEVREEKASVDVDAIAQRIYNEALPWEPNEDRPPFLRRLKQAWDTSLTTDATLKAIKAVLVDELGGEAE